ncbi:uncharacterized protein [Apostichopus japonicus]|uniref:uncharacterized protein n=1 Tax=Stichopus japonicus TaxID=307972 RepID=UPI003AB1E6E9
MPLALRRSGPPIDVVGVSTVSADLTFERYVNTGRYNAPHLPQNVAFPTPSGFSGTVGGFSAPLQSSGRGRRFGVCSFRFNPAGEGNTVTIPAIATENSGFTNTRYCYTANSNEAVTLTAKMTQPLMKFMSSLQWSFTFVDQGTGSASNPVVPPCIFSGNNRLSCELQNVQKDTSEGVYEVFRPRRKLRNWHPLFYLFVRSCGAGTYGANCGLTCNACVNGWCDSDCGTCVCFPGWMGVDCDTPCSSADEVGQSCGITCSSIFSDNVDCKGLLISYPAKVPCSCRSGLMPPECQDDCEEGYWGPNCANKCPTGTTNCNVRTGL